MNVNSECVLLRTMKNENIVYKIHSCLHLLIFCIVFNSFGIGRESQIQNIGIYVDLTYSIS